MTTCIICQTLEQDPSEPQLHRLVRFYERKVGELSNRLVDDEQSERWELEHKIREQQEIIDKQALIIANHRRTK